MLCLCLQEVSGLKCVQLLSSGQALPSECVSGLVELTGNPNTSLTLTTSIISLLAQLGGAHLHSYHMYIQYIPIYTEHAPQPDCSGSFYVSITLKQELGKIFELANLIADRDRRQVSNAVKYDVTRLSR